MKEIQAATKKLVEEGLAEMKLLTKAVEIAAVAHEGQFDRAGKPYILHPFTVALMQQKETEAIVGLLHDVVEDSRFTLEDLKEAGFPETVLEPVRLLTRQKGMGYSEYIEHLCKSKNKIALKVKLADLLHNSDLSRLPAVSDEDTERQKKYLQAIQHILEEI